MFLFYQNESLQRNLDDFEKVVKVQHSRSMETELLEKNLKDLKIKFVFNQNIKCVIKIFVKYLNLNFYRLYNEEQARKTEVAALKVRYDNRMTILSEELKNSQFQTLRFKRERDSYKQMLDSADSVPQNGNHNNQVILIQYMYIL